MMAEEILEKLIDDIHGKTVSVLGKTITVKAVPSEEFQDFEEPTVSMIINPYSRGYGAMGKLKCLVDKVHWFSQAVKADVELRVSAAEERKGDKVLHPKYVTEKVMEMVKKRVLVSWQRILVNYKGAVRDNSIKAERDFTKFVEAAGRSWRYLRVEIEFEDVWNMLLDGESADDNPVKVITFKAENDGESIDTKMVVVDT